MNYFSFHLHFKNYITLFGEIPAREIFAIFGQCRENVSREARKFCLENYSSKNVLNQQFEKIYLAQIFNRLVICSWIYTNCQRWIRVGAPPIASPIPFCPVNRQYSRKKTQIEKIANSALHLKTDFRRMMVEERLNDLSLVCIHRNIFLDYGKIINIYASKYPRRMLLINPLSEN